MGVLTDPLGWFTLEVPEGWATRTEDSVTTLTGPRGLGMVYLSGGRHARGPQIDFGGADFLQRFLHSIGVEVELAAIGGSEGTGCRIYHYEREERGRLWRYWSVTDDETALLISYTCDTRQAGRESGDVDRMVRSVRLYHSVVH